MNPKRLPEVIMVACLIGLAAWWWWPVKPVAVPVKTPVARLHPAAQADETSVPPTEAAAESPAIPGVAVVETPAPATTFDPQADLSTAIPDFIRLVQAGDFATLLQNYVPPEEFLGIPEEEKAKVIKEMQSPEHQQEMQKAVWELQAVQSMPPVYNADKTRATYTPPDGSSKIVFVNENGRWYIQ